MVRMMLSPIVSHLVPLKAFSSLFSCGEIRYFRWMRTVRLREAKLVVQVNRPSQSLDGDLNPGVDPKVHIFSCYIILQAFI